MREICRQRHPESAFADSATRNKLARTGLWYCFSERDFNIGSALLHSRVLPACNACLMWADHYDQISLKVGVISKVKHTGAVLWGARRQARTSMICDAASGNKGTQVWFKNNTIRFALVDHKPFVVGS